MKKLSILVVACALSLGAVACGKKKDPVAPSAGETTEGAGDMGGSTYGGDAYGGAAPDGADGANPCGGDTANPCGG